jgi:hypothetical protein
MDCVTQVERVRRGKPKMTISHVNFFFNAIEVIVLWVVLVDVRAIRNKLP